MRRLRFAAFALAATGLACTEGSRPMPFTLPPLNERAVALVFGVQPRDGHAGEALHPFQVAVVGVSGRPDTTANIFVSVSIINDGCGADVRGTTRVMAVRGVAWFTDLVLNRPCTVNRAGKVVTGGYRFRTTGNALRSDTSEKFGVALGPPRSIQLRGTEFTARVGQPVSRVFTASNGVKRVDPYVPFVVVDAGGNQVPWTGQVTVTIGNNPAGASLSGHPGMLIDQANGWVSEFWLDDIRVSKAGAGYTLVLAAPGLKPDTTAPFTTNP